MASGSAWCPLDCRRDPVRQLLLHQNAKPGKAIAIAPPMLMPAMAPEEIWCFGACFSELVCPVAVVEVRAVVLDIAMLPFVTNGTATVVVRVAVAIEASDDDMSSDGNDSPGCSMMLPDSSALVACLSIELAFLGLMTPTMP